MLKKFLAITGVVILVMGILRIGYFQENNPIEDTVQNDTITTMNYIGDPQESPFICQTKNLRAVAKIIGRENEYPIISLNDSRFYKGTVSGGSWVDRREWIFQVDTMTDKSLRFVPGKYSNILVRFEQRYGKSGYVCHIEAMPNEGNTISEDGIAEKVPL